MRALLISPLPPARDGIADYTAKLADGYLEAGVDVALVSTTRAPAAHRAPVLGHLSWSPLTWFATVRTVRRWQPQVVHLQHGIATYGPLLPPVWLFVLAVRLGGARVLVTHHEVTRDLERLQKAGRIYYRLVSRTTDVVHVHTEASAAMARSVLRLADRRVLVAPHPVYDLPLAGVSPEALRERHALQGLTVILAFGYIHVEKGLRELVEGVAVLFERAPDLRDTTRLVVAGDVRPRSPAFAKFERADRDYLAEVVARVEALGLQDQVVLTGHVPADELTAWFQAADLGVLPYTHTEQSGVAQLALAADLPVVASRVGGLRELFADTLPAFESLEPDAIADALLSQLNSERGQVWRAQYALVRERASARSLVVEATTRLGVPLGGPRRQRVAP